MKKLFTILALCALTLSASATYRVYLCGITELTVDTLQSTTKNQFTLNFHQKCKNTAEYSKPETFYESDVKLVLNSDDRTLEGTYTTEGASTTSSSANVNDQTINLITSEFTSGSTSRLLRKDSISTFTIEKIDDTHYAITTGNLVFSQRVNQVDTWAYRYSYDADHILEEGISKTPFVFGWEAGYFEEFYSYDLTVTGLDIHRVDNDYNTLRYLFTMQCSGKNRDNGDERNYEVRLSLYPLSETIAGTFITQGSETVLMPMDSHVRDLKAGKTRNLNNDSISQVTIINKGNNHYTFKGGPLICTDLDANYSAIYGEKRIEATHYYYFNDNDGAGIDFNWDPESEDSELTTTDLKAIYEELKGKSVKVLRDGQLIIIRDNEMFNMVGTKL